MRLLADKPADTAADGWSLMNRVTLCVVDGPGETGYLFPRIGLEAPSGWDEATDSLGGAFVVFGQEDGREIFARSL